MIKQKNCILTPTFRGHFQYLDNYLKSYDFYVEDKEDCTIFFIINKSENKELKQILKKYQHLDIQVLFFEDILEHFGIKETPEFLLEEYGKFSFQSLKKFYGMLYLEKYKHFLVLDTETMWANKTNMTHMFKKFFNKDHFILYSNVSKRLATSASNQEASDNINYILGSKCNKWFVEQFVRFWDVNILKDIFKRYGSCYDIVKKLHKKELHAPVKIGLFESVLYDQFVYENQKKYGYRCIDIDRLLEKCLSKDSLSAYKKKFFDDLSGNSGLTEFFMLYLDKDNIDGFIKFCKEIPLNILRCDDTRLTLKRLYWENVLMNAVQPNILACSQAHYFSLNKNKIFLTEKFDAMKRHCHDFVLPIYDVLCWACTPLRILKYFIKWIVGLPKAFCKYYILRRKK